MNSRGGKRKCQVPIIDGRPNHPSTTHTLREEVEELFPCRGYNAIQSEEYTQWVIEDKFASDFPDLSQVGATITNDLEPYEETKIRILNGGHTA